MVFVAASITGGMQTLPVRKFIVKHLQQRGYEVPSIHNAADDPIRAFVEKIGDPTATTPVHFRRWNNRWIEEAKLFVAEASLPSSGLGAEFERCILKQRLGLNLTPMLCLHKAGKTVSPHLIGIELYEERYVWFRPYDTMGDISLILDQFIAAFG
jgi:hypothetical protein